MSHIPFQSPFQPVSVHAFIYSEANICGLFVHVDPLLYAEFRKLHYAAGPSGNTAAEEEIMGVQTCCWK